MSKFKVFTTIAFKIFIRKKIKVGVIKVGIGG